MFRTLILPILHKNIVQNMWKKDTINPRHWKYSQFCSTDNILSQFMVENWQIHVRCVNHEFFVPWFSSNFVITWDWIMLSQYQYWGETSWAELGSGKLRLTKWLIFNLSEVSSFDCFLQHSKNEWELAKNDFNFINFLIQAMFLSIHFDWVYAGSLLPGLWSTFYIEI